jgi:peptidyl-prolyl cis-trans isomerase D
MATLQKIRDRGPLIAIVIGFALFAFIFTDMFSGGKSMFGSSETAVAVVDGESVDIRDFQQRFIMHKDFIQFANQRSNLDQEQEKQIREEVWNIIVNEKLLVDRLKEMGLWVSDREAADLILGGNRQRDPIMQQIAIFTDPQTRQFAPQAVRQFFNSYMSTSDEAKRFGLYLEDIVRSNKAQNKYQTLIAKGMNITNPEARQLYKNRVHVVDFDYAFKAYKTLEDEEISVSEDELKAYYDEHKNNYEQDHTRDIAYLAFNIEPSQKDREKDKESVAELKKEMQKIDIDDTDALISFARANSDTRFTNKFYAEGEYPVPEVDSLLHNAQVGDIIGPYEEDGFFKIAAVVNRAMVPDTVQASHILIAPDGQEIADMTEAREMIDSLETAYRNGDSFEDLADEFSFDAQSALEGGDLGKFTEERMIKNLSDSVFYANTGDIKKVKTQYGWHLVKVTYQSPKRMKVFPVIVSRDITPGKKTIDETYAKAAGFAAKATSIDAFDKEAQALNMTKRVATDLSPTTRTIAGLDNAERILSWAFKDDTEEGDLSAILQDKEQFIVAILTEIREEGIAPFEQVKEVVTAEVIKDKKAEIFSEEFDKALPSENNLQTLAEKTGSEFETAKNIAFSSSILPGIGAEPRVIGNAVSMKADEVSEPIKGESGVFVVKVLSVTAKENIEENEIQNDRLNAQRRLVFRASQQFMETLKDRAEITDNRHKFF